jgi:hypothetical protein
MAHVDYRLSLRRMGIASMARVTLMSASISIKRSRYPAPGIRRPALVARSGFEDRVSGIGFRVSDFMVGMFFLATLSVTFAVAQSPDILVAQAAGQAVASSVEPAAARMILVVGAAGTSEYHSQFRHDADQWVQLARGRGMDLIHISEELSTSGQEQRELLRTALVSADDEDKLPLWIVLIGHGTSERGTHKFNLVGPDVSAKDLSDWFKEINRPIILINCSSASAPFLPELSAPRRIVVTATRSGSENNYSRFGSQLANSILDPNTDIDHDEEVSLLEAFLSASAKTEKFYQEQSRLATEHALIDDNGDKLGTGSEFFRGTRAVKSAQAGKQLDGLVANKVMLYSSPAVPKLDSTELVRRDEIESQINELRNRKTSPPTAQYWDQLETLLLELAKLYQ